MKHHRPPKHIFPHNPSWQPTPVVPLFAFSTRLARSGCTLRYAKHVLA
jgi:hypothetical protein